MDLNVLIAVSVIWCVAATTPGPNFFIVVHTAIGTTQRLSLVKP
jgi:threonine/homoserine/homoserine lactone efflux protein